MVKTGSQVRVTYPTLSREQVLERLRQAYSRLKTKLPVSKVILYGSYATGRYTAGSDIDLLVVYEGEHREDAYKLVLSEIALPRLEPKVYTQQEFNILISRSRKLAAALNKEGIEIP
ncbi:MAG: nucleotidyltransferase domain-containing protein [Candidatus Bathyarchaeia archaeon]